MKIICTTEEKEWLLESFMTSETLCIFSGSDFAGCPADISCRECLEKKIELEIKDGDDNDPAL